MARTDICALLIVAMAGMAAQPAHAQEGPRVALDNEYVRVTRNVAPCAAAAAGTCEDRVILAMGDLELKSGGNVRKMKRGEIAIFKAGESYEPPTGLFFEVTVKPNHPPVKGPPEVIPPPKNLMVFEGARFFIYEEKLEPGDTRPRHSHAQRVEIRLNTGPMLQQWIYRADGVSETEPSIVNWREPIVHMVKNIGDMPLRNFILEFIPPR
jgi:hypothetical protein